jgi:hypothetical protein
MGSWATPQTGLVQAVARPDVGCILVNRAFEPHYPDDSAVGVTVVEGPRSLVRFVMRLLEQLQGWLVHPRSTMSVPRTFAREGRPVMKDRKGR